MFDSSGPEGKVRGTPQQIIDKYNQLARDAQLSGDRVATENFQQHAEHYLRLLGEAQKEQDAKREEQERQNRERQAERDRERNERQEREQGGGDQPAAPQPDMAAGGETHDSGLVETPETQPKPKRARKPRKPASAEPGNKGDADAESGGDKQNNGPRKGASEAAE